MLEITNISLYVCAQVESVSTIDITDQCGVDFML